MTITIKHRWTGAVLFTSDTATTTAEALAEAVKARADLAGAYLARANLAGADLARANLADADLARANLADADLAGAYLAGANLADARGLPSNAESKAAEPMPEVPVIPNIHQAVLAAVTAQGCRLNMRQWHECETSHCRAGWVVHLAGEKGKALEYKLGTRFAAAAIYRASDPGCRVPHFFCTDERAMENIKACAEREKAAATSP